MKIKLQQVVNAYMATKNIEKDKASFRWSYAIARNRAKMQPEIEGLIEAEKKIVAIDQERVKWCEDHAQKDQDGKPIIKDNAYLGVEAYDPELLEILKRMTDANSDRINLLKTECEIDLFMVDFKDVPEQIAPVDVENLMVMIKEPETK